MKKYLAFIVLFFIGCATTPTTQIDPQLSKASEMVYSMELLVALCPTAAKYVCYYGDKEDCANANNICSTGKDAVVVAKGLIDVAEQMNATPDSKQKALEAVMGLGNNADAIIKLLNDAGIEPKPLLIPKTLIYRY